VGLVIFALRRIAWLPITRVAGEIIVLFRRGVCSGCGGNGEEDDIIKVIVVGGPGDQHGGVEDCESVSSISSFVISTNFSFIESLAQILQLANRQFQLNNITVIVGGSTQIVSYGMESLVQQFKECVAATSRCFEMTWIVLPL